jgi:hypothetical protein
VGVIATQGADLVDVSVALDPPRPATAASATPTRDRQRLSFDDAV